MRTLVVFVHGLGAGSTTWWGATEVAVEHHPDLDADVKFWRYETSHGGIGWVRNLRNRFGSGRKRQGIRQLGDELWDNIRLWNDQGEPVTSLRFVGHSMGGLVVAAATGRECETNVDKQLLDALDRVVFIASPMGGANLANLARQVTRLTGGNVHVEELKPRSTALKEIVNKFIYKVIRERGVIPIIFRASQDATVSEAELIAPFRRIEYEGVRTLRGGHSECVIDLEANSPQLEKIIQALSGQGPRTRLRTLAREYEMIRASEPSSYERAQRLDVVVNDMKAAAHEADHLVPALMSSGSPGERLAAIAILEERPDPNYLDWLATRMAEESSDYVKYLTAMALLSAAQKLGPDPGGAVRGAVMRAKDSLEEAERSKATYRRLEEAERHLDSRG